MVAEEKVVAYGIPAALDRYSTRWDGALNWCLLIVGSDGVLVIGIRLKMGLSGVGMWMPGCWDW